MKKFSTYLLVMFMILFWLLRIVITLASQFGTDFMGIKPINNTYEIILLFGFLPCIILVVKRNIIGPLLYIVLHAIYFGEDVTSKINLIMNNYTLSIVQVSELMFSVIGCILPVVVLIDLLLDKNRKINPKDKKTDWFYKNEQYDRKFDDRADRNNYRTM